jgi:hypothetical protein
LILIPLFLFLMYQAPCERTPITAAEATALVLEVPNARRSISERGAKLAAQIERPVPNGWLFKVYATNTKSLSSLVGYYIVDERTAAVTDYSFDGVPVSSKHLRAEQSRLLKKHCAD